VGVSVAMELITRRDSLEVRNCRSWSLSAHLSSKRIPRRSTWEASASNTSARARPHNAKARSERCRSSFGAAQVARSTGGSALVDKVASP